MDPASFFSSSGMTLQVFLIDLLLSGDNAVVIALACRHLPPAQRRMAMLIGAGAGVFLRVALTLLVNVVMGIPTLKLLGALALIVIAINLIVDRDDEDIDATASEQAANLASAVLTIVVADLAMSVDNVLALAAVAQNSVSVLILGLLLSVPLLMYGSVLLGRLLARYPWLVPAGGALLGWVAGDIAMTDPLIADWVNTQSPALTVAVPWLTALFVTAQSRNLLSNPTTQERHVALATSTTGEILLAPLAESSTGSATRIATSATSAPAPIPPIHSALRVKEAESAPAIAQDLACAEDEFNATTQASPASGPLFKPRLRIALATIAGIAATASVVVASLPDDDAVSSRQSSAWSLLPQPKQLERFQCPYFDAVLLYRHGSEKLAMTVSGMTIEGILADGTIHWRTYDKSKLPADFVLPSRIVNDTDRTATIEGSQLSPTQCKRF